MLTLSSEIQSNPSTPRALLIVVLSVVGLLVMKMPYHYDELYVHILSVAVLEPQSRAGTLRGLRAEQPLCMFVVVQLLLPLLLCIV